MQAAPGLGKLSLHQCAQTLFPWAWTAVTGVVCRLGQSICSCCRRVGGCQLTEREHEQDQAYHLDGGDRFLGWDYEVF